MERSWNELAEDEKTRIHVEYILGSFRSLAELSRVRKIKIGGLRKAAEEGQWVSQQRLAHEETLQRFASLAERAALETGFIAISALRASFRAVADAIEEAEEAGDIGRVLELSADLEKLLDRMSQMQSIITTANPRAPTPADETRSDGRPAAVTGNSKAAVAALVEVFARQRSAQANNAKLAEGREALREVIPEKPTFDVPEGTAGELR